MLRQPAGLGARRAAFLQGIEESMGDEGIVAGASIPGGGRHLGDAADDLHGQAVASIRHQAAPRLADVTPSDDTDRAANKGVNPPAETRCTPAGRSADRKSTRMNSSHSCASRMTSSA